MALKVWLPLDGTLENKGISDVIVTNNGATVDNNGKIGKCYSFDGADDWIKVTIPSNMTSLKNCSIMMWGMGNRGFGGISHDTGATLATCNCFDGRWQFANGSTWVYYNGGSASTTVWHHFAITISNTTITTYYDGTQITSVPIGSELMALNSSNFIEIGCDHPGGDEYGAIKVNDFRIYDHCLSQKEIKEISQGLVLHYKLDGWSGGTGENLITNSGPKDLTNWSSAGTGWANSLVDCYISPSGKAVRNTYSGTTAVAGGIHKQPIDYTALENGAIYTFSAYIRASKTCQITFKNEMMTSTTSGTFTPTITTEWKRYEVSGIINTSSTYHSNVMYVVASAAEQNMWIEACMIKLEKGSSATEWSLTPSEMGIDKTKIKDSSGYEHNGNISNNSNFITEQINNARYNTALKFTNSQIICSNYNTYGLNTLTYSAWVYPTERHNERSCIIIGGTYMTIDTNGKLSGYAYGKSPEGYHTGITTIPLNQWTHIALVWTETNLIGYINGAQDFLVACTGSFNHTVNQQIGREGDSGRIFKGYINDLRIYATALSAEDVLDLYHTPVNIDNLSNLHTFELNENGNGMLGLSTENIYNNYNGGTATLNNGIWTVTSPVSTSTWGPGISLKSGIFKYNWNERYIYAVDVYTPTAHRFVIDFNNTRADGGTNWGSNDNDATNQRLNSGSPNAGTGATGIDVPANTWTTLWFSTENTSASNTDHAPLYDYSGLGLYTVNDTASTVWYLKNPRWYIVNDNDIKILKNGLINTQNFAEGFKSRFFKQGKEIEAAGFIEK